LAIPVILMGLGPIGRGIARAVLGKPELEIVAALDLDEARVGKSLAEILELPKAPNVTVTRDAPAAFKKAAGLGAVMLHATHSRLDQVEGELAQALSAGICVVSTCEELAYPWLRHPEIAGRLDKIAQKRNVALLGTGVNPGFVLDRLPATLGAVCGKVERVHAIRIVDARTLRSSLQQRVGAGLNEEEFDRGVDEGSIGHVGLMESAALAALGVGLQVDEVEESIDPLEADEDMGSDLRVEGALFVPRGGIVGVHQIATAFHNKRAVAQLELTIALGAENPRDEIELFASPGIKVIIPGGLAGDSGTSWAIVHAAPLVVSAQPGLITVLDLPAGR